MIDKKQKLVIAAWEIGHSESFCGVKVGGMGAVVQELPIEMAKYAQEQKIPLTIEILSPCFRFYDRNNLKKEGEIVDSQFHLSYEVYSHIFETCRGFEIKHLYFWNEDILGDFAETNPAQSIYPENSWQAMRIYARLCAAMAQYLKQNPCTSLHLHDYHVGFLPFYLPNDFAHTLFTIHNADYQGWMEVWQDPDPVMYELAMPAQYYQRYFEYWSDFNIMKGVLLKIIEISGVVTTVSEGYAKELHLEENDIRQMAREEGLENPKKVSAPNRGLAELAWSKIIGIDNGLAEDNRPRNNKFLDAEFLNRIQQNHKSLLFYHPIVQEKMLHENHQYDFDNWDIRLELRRLLFLECFDGIPEEDDIVFCSVGRIAPQKNLEALLGCMEPIVHHHSNVRFVVMVSPPIDSYGKNLGKYFRQLAQRNPNIYYSARFNIPLSRLVLAGSNYCVIPSRTEPCGLVDYEAALFGNIPIVRKTGGLIKTLPHGYGYSWYDEEDYWGESLALTKTIEKAIDEYVQYPQMYQKRVKNCMTIDTSWVKAVKLYFQYLKIS